MGEFHDSVSTLLQAFSHGISIIKTQRIRREKQRLPLETPQRVAETHLSKSLKKNRADVKGAYDRDAARLGPGFADGDSESRSSIASILFRLNAGFVSVIERFTKGKSTATDYQALLNLSNASRMEAMYTFEQLSQRLSTASLTTSPTSKHSKQRRHRNKSKKVPSAVEKYKQSPSRSAPQLTITPFGFASPEGWVRPKPKRKVSSDPKISGSSTPKYASSKKSSTHLSKPAGLSPRPLPSFGEKTTPVSPAQISAPAPPMIRSKVQNRVSLISFASDSTKLGEIPEHKWARPKMYEATNIAFPITTYYPLEPYQQPEKQRSRFMRLFRR